MKKTLWTVLTLVSVAFLAGRAMLTSAMRTAEEGVRIRMENRFGDRVSVESLRAGPGSLHLENVEVTFEERGIHMDAPSIEARFGLQQVIARDPIPDSVHLKRPRLSVDLNALLAHLDLSVGLTESSPDRPREPALSGRSGELVLEEAWLLLTSGSASIRLQEVSGRFRSRHGKLTADLEGEVEGGGRWQGKFLRDENGLKTEMEFESVSGSALSGVFPKIPWHHAEGTRMTGRLKVQSSDLEHFLAEAEFEVLNLGVRSPRVSTRAVRVNRLAAAGDLEFSPGEHRLCLKDGRIETGQARATAEGEFFWDEAGKRIALNLEMPPTPAASFLESIPRGLSEEWRDFEADGDLTATLALGLDFSNPGDLKLDIDFEDDSRFRSAPGRLSAEDLRRPFRRAVFVGDQRHEIRTGPGSDNWVSLSAISPFMIQAVLAHEDAAFYRHRGFAPWAIETALARNLRRGRFAFGASTITMQLAKNLYLSHEKTMDRKISEAILTWWLERELSKSEILELYLNVIEYGPGVYGLRAAAHHYFRKSPARLTPAESVFLACILPAPRRYHRQLERGELSDWYREQMEFLLEHMAERGRIDETARDHGMEQIDHFRFRSGEDEAVVWSIRRGGEPG